MSRFDAVVAFMGKSGRWAFKMVKWLWKQAIAQLTVIRIATNWLVDLTRRSPVFMTLAALAAICWSLLGRFLGIWSMLPVALAACLLLFPQQNGKKRGDASTASGDVIDAEYTEFEKAQM